MKRFLPAASYLSILFLASILAIVSGSVQIVQGNNTSNINATIKISVCGNEVAEGGESCDNTDLANKTCASLGFQGGALSCDIGCGFNTSQCVPFPPSPQEAGVVSPTLPKDHEEDNPNGAKTQETLPNLDTPRQTVPLETGQLTIDLKDFGMITSSSLPDAVKKWVDLWKKSLSSNAALSECDLNNDHTCSQQDLSIMLYYVGRKP